MCFYYDFTNPSILFIIKGPQTQKNRKGKF